MECGEGGLGTLGPARDSQTASAFGEPGEAGGKASPSGTGPAQGLLQTTRPFSTGIWSWEMERGSQCVMKVRRIGARVRGARKPVCRPDCETAETVLQERRGMERRKRVQKRKVSLDRESGIPGRSLVLSDAPVSGGSLSPILTRPLKST